MAINEALPTAIATLAQRERNLTSLQTAAVMEYSGPGKHVKARERLLVRRPSSLRVEALSPLGVALVVTADSNEIAVFDPGQNTIARGPASAATLDRVASIPLAPAQAVRMLLALAPSPELLTTAPQPSSKAAADTVYSFLVSGTRYELSFSGNELETVRERAADGSIAYEVNYSDYRDIGGTRFPYMISASFPVAATTIKLLYQLPLIDVTIPDSAFMLEPKQGTKEFQLGLAADKEFAGR